MIPQNPLHSRIHTIFYYQHTREYMKWHILLFLVLFSTVNIWYILSPKFSVGQCIEYKMENEYNIVIITAKVIDYKMLTNYKLQWLNVYILWLPTVEDIMFEVKKPYYSTLTMNNVNSHSYRTDCPK